MEKGFDFGTCHVCSCWEHSGCHHSVRLCGGEMEKGRNGRDGIAVGIGCVEGVENVWRAFEF